MNTYIVIEKNKITNMVLYKDEPKPEEIGNKNIIPLAKIHSKFYKWCPNTECWLADFSTGIASIGWDWDAATNTAIQPLPDFELTETAQPVVTSSNPVDKLKAFLAANPDVAKILGT